MRAMIETMEGRTLFSAAPGIPKGLLAQATASADPTVQADLAVAQADAAAATAAHAKVLSDSADARTALRKAQNTGNDLLKADRTAVLVALNGTDSAALTAAQTKLSTDTTQVATDVATAKAAVKAASADGRTALKDATKSLKTHLKQLKTDLRAATKAAAATASA
jgi:hypothetical protein